MMTRYRALGTPRELCCCLPTPFRIPKPVAGLAFNFSLVEVSSPAASHERNYVSSEAAERSIFALATPTFSAAT